MTRSGRSVESPFGRLCLWVEDGALCAVTWGGPVVVAADPVLDLAEAELAAYCAGEEVAFTVPLAPPASDFAGRVREVLCAIPLGETRTYGEIARALGVSAQAAGQACGANPIPILVPCHRVLSATGLGGYSGAGGVETKVALLRHEGAGGLLL